MTQNRDYRTAEKRIFAVTNWSLLPLLSSMMLACFGGHPEVCEQLLEMGASLKAQDTGGSNVLHWAVDGDKTGCLRWLLDKGVKVRKAATFIRESLYTFSSSVIPVRLRIRSLLAPWELPPSLEPRPHVALRVRLKTQTFFRLQKFPGPHVVDRSLPYAIACLESLHNR